MKTVDFLDAHERHRADAEYLFEASRYPNADHLFGLSAECGLKHVMKLLGMRVTAPGMPEDRGDRVHINEAWLRFETYRSRAPSSGFLPLPDNPFENWHISDRYGRQADFDKAAVERHREGACQVIRLVAAAKRDGVI